MPRRRRGRGCDAGHPRPRGHATRACAPSAGGSACKRPIPNACRGGRSRQAAVRPRRPLLTHRRDAVAHQRARDAAAAKRRVHDDRRDPPASAPTGRRRTVRRQQDVAADDLAVDARETRIVCGFRRRRASAALSAARPGERLSIEAREAPACSASSRDVRKPRCRRLYALIPSRRPSVLAAPPITTPSPAASERSASFERAWPAPCQWREGGICDGRNSDSRDGSARLG